MAIIIEPSIRLPAGATALKEGGENMDSTVLMAAWTGLPDPGLMPPVNADDREKPAKEAGGTVRIVVRSAKPRKSRVVPLRSAIA